MVYGGAAGGGKSYGLLLDPLRYINVPGFGAVIFRRESPQITNEGGLWDTSEELYPLVGATQRVASLSWLFPGGQRIRFAHLHEEKDKEKWQGAQVPYIGFDELTHFTESQFFYMLSRNRSTCGVPPCVRATCNPAPGWVKEFLAPWLDKNREDRAQSGEVRYFLRKNGEIIWLRPGETHLDGEPGKSVTFIRSTVYDNRILLAVNPEYLQNLKSLPLVEQARLLDGDWDVFEGAFFTEWSEATCDVLAPWKGQSPPPYWPKFGGFDWGKQNPASFGAYASDEAGAVWGFDEFHEAGLSNTEQANRILRILEKHGIVARDFPIYADPSMFPPKDPKQRIGEYNVEAFWKAGLNFIPAVNDRVNGWARVREFLHAEKFKTVKGCMPALVREFPLAQYHKTRAEDMDDDGDTQGHFDALNRHRYAMMSRPRPSKPDPSIPVVKKKPDYLQQMADQYQREQRRQAGRGGFGGWR